MTRNRSVKWYDIGKEPFQKTIINKQPFALVIRVIILSIIGEKIGGSLMRVVWWWCNQRRLKGAHKGTLTYAMLNMNLHTTQGWSL